MSAEDFELLSCLVWSKCVRCPWALKRNRVARVVRVVQKRLSQGPECRQTEKMDTPSPHTMLHFGGHILLRGPEFLSNTAAQFSSYSFIIWFSAIINTMSSIWHCPLLSWHYVLFCWILFCPIRKFLDTLSVRYTLENLSNSHWTMCPMVIGQCVQ